MEREHRRVRRHLGWLIAGAVGVTMLVAAPAALAVVDTTEPAAPTSTTPAAPPATATTSPVATTDSSAPSEPIATEPPAATEPADTTDTVDTTEPAASTEPVATEPASSAPADTTASVATSEPPASSVEPDCTPLVDGDGPVTVPAGCELPAPSVAANPSLSPTCGVTVTIVVDRSASIDAGAVRSALTALVDALSGTGATVSLVDFSDSATLRIAADRARRLDREVRSTATSAGSPPVARATSAPGWPPPQPRRPTSPWSSPTVSPTPAVRRRTPP